MDEAFWSNVVKRWSEASESVIKLKKELAKVHEERELYRDVVQNLRKAGGLGEASGSRLRPPGSGHTRHESARTFAGEEENASSLKDELKDAEAGLGRAKEEYRRLQNDLTEATERIQVLSTENAELLALQRQEIATIHDERQKMLKLLKDLEDARLENQRLVDKVAQLEEEMTRMNEISDRVASDRTPTISVKPSTLNPLERQIESLKESLQSKETENDELRNEVEIAEEKFYRAEEKNKAMMESIMKLQNITRHSTRSLRNLSPNYLTSSPRSTKVSLMSIPNRSGILEGIENNKRISTSSAPAATASNVEDTTVIDSHPGSLQSPYSALPEEREKVLTKLPVADINNTTSNNSFDREFLKGVLGSLVERSSGSADKKLTTISYLCPTLNHHPWCPTLPGQHGYIFVGLGKEKETYKTPVVRNLFVGLPKDQARQRRFRYLGKYRVVRVRSLSLEEWISLPNDTKLMYARLTKEKTKDNHSAEEILESYNRDDVSVPCVMLQHLSFDEQLFNTLISQQDAGRRA